MSTNKHAIIRYQALDKCFSNWGRKYFINDLIDACNNAIYEFSGLEGGIKRRQLYDDIKFMESEQGYSIELDKIRDGKKVYYRYHDKNFSINNSPLNQTEAEYLNNVVTILQRFDGAPGFEWVGELSLMLSEKFDLKDFHKKVMSFDSNIDYSGYKFITPIFNAIVNKRVLKINYESFQKDKYELEFHPYFLKQYNNRWFLFGKNSTNNINQWNLPLDRIKDIKEIDIDYIEDQTDWEEYFSDFIGVTKLGDRVIEVKLLFVNEQAQYILTKPIHETQKPKLNEDGSIEVRIKVIPNYELESMILSFGEKVRVLEPKELKDKIFKRINKTIENYLL